jgi:ADP-ribose pyrophosphatase YjhB (NUDIX family)
MIAQLPMFAKNQATADTSIKVGVGVFVKDALDRILLEKRSDCGLWGLPGGGIESGETIKDAAMREVKEETGLHVTVTRFIGVYSNPEERIITYPDNGDVRHLIDIVVEAEIISGQLTLSDESIELSFFGISEIPDEIVPPAVRPIEDFRKGKINNIS